MIKLIFLDVDGCLTDGGIYNANGGDEWKRFDVKDGFLLQQWNKMGGHASAIITGKSSQIVADRAKLLGVKYCIQGAGDKLAMARSVLALEGAELGECAAIGDDLNDLRLLGAVGLSFAPKNAVREVRGRVGVRLRRRGGGGAVREMIEEILRRNGEWEDFVARWV